MISGFFTEFSPKYLKNVKSSQLHSGRDNTSPPFDERDNQPLKPADGATTFPESSVPSTTCPGKEGEKIPKGTLEPAGA